MNILLLNRDFDVGGDTTFIKGLCGVLRAHGHRTFAMAQPGEMAPRVADACDQLVLKRVLFPLQRYGLRAFLRRHAIDVVNVHSYTQARVIAPVCAAEQIPLIITMHGPVRPRRLAAWQPLFALASAVMVMNENLANFYANAGVPPERLFLTRLFLDWSAAGQRPARRPHVAAYCSRLSGLKGPMAESWLRGLRLLEGIEDWRILVIGDGSHRRKLEQVAGQLGLRAEFLGNVTEAATLFPQVDVLAGGGFVALEGLHAGCAVVGIGFNGCFGAVTPATLPRALAFNFGDHALYPLGTEPDAIAAALRTAADLVTTGEAARVSDLAGEQCGIGAVSAPLGALFQHVAGGQSVAEISLPYRHLAPPVAGSALA